MISKMRLKILIFPAMIVGISAVILSISIYGYSRLSDETLVAEITFDELVNNSHIAHLTTVEQCQTTDYYPIYGDQWQIDARFLKWKPWANLIGLDASYRLDRLQGRYRKVYEQNQGPHQAHDLAFENVLDIAKLNDYLGESNMLMDTRYGSSAYHGIDPDMRYLIYRSQSGLFVRIDLRTLDPMGKDILSTEMTKACGAQMGYWQALFHSISKELAKAQDWMRGLFS